MRSVTRRPDGREDPCRACGGRGWKFRGFRRSVASAGDAGERAMLGRVRVRCLACNPPGPEGGSDE
jgi:hypothetical protein